MKIQVITKEDKADFINKVGKAIKSGVEAYQGAVTPSLVTDVADVISSILGSSAGELTEANYYKITKMGKAVVRIDVLSIGLKVDTKGMQTESLSIVGLYFCLSSIDVNQLDENEKLILDVMNP